MNPAVPPMHGAGWIGFCQIRPEAGWIRPMSQKQYAAVCAYFQAQTAAYCSFSNHSCVILSQLRSHDAHW
jgi:hypothetical protein